MAEKIIVLLLMLIVSTSMAQDVENLSFALEGNIINVNKLDQYFQDNSKLQDQVNDIVYHINIIEPDPGIDYKIILIEPSSGMDYKIRILDPQTRKEIVERESIISKILMALHN